MDRRRDPELQSGIAGVVADRGVRAAHHRAVRGPNGAGDAAHQVLLPRRHDIDELERATQPGERVRHEIAVPRDAVTDRRMGDLEQDGAQSAREQHPLHLQLRRRRQPSPASTHHEPRYRLARRPCQARADWSVRLAT